MSSSISINYIPNKGQAAFHASKAKYKAMVGALGSGKSSTGCVESIMLALENPGTVGLVSRFTLPELKTTTMEIFFSFLPPELIINYNKSDRILLVKTNQDPATIYFGPLDSINRYKSLNLGFFFIDEGDETTEDMWRFLCGRLRRKGVRHSAMLATNPTTTSHWIYKRWVESPPRDYELFRSKTMDNAMHLPDGYVDDLKNNFPADWQKRYLEGEFGILQTGDPVFPDFSQSLHVRDIPFQSARPLLRGWDFGYNHPCVVFAQFDELQRFKILDVILGSSEDLHIFANRVITYTREHFPNATEVRDFCDPSGVAQRDTGKPSISVLQDKRVYPKFRMSRPDERAAEMRVLMRTFAGGLPMFQVHPRAGYLIEAFTGGVQYHVKRDGSKTEEIKKDGYFEHGFDATGYIIANTTMLDRDNTIDDYLIVDEPNYSYGEVA